MNDDVQPFFDICVAYKFYMQVHDGRVLIALGEYVGTGATLREAANDWCTNVQRQRPALMQRDTKQRPVR